MRSTPQRITDTAHMKPRLISLSIWLACVCSMPRLQAQTGPGRCEITVVERVTGKPIPSRIHLKDADGRPVRANGLPNWRDHFVCPGHVQMELPSGGYSYEVERGL